MKENKYHILELEYVNESTHDIAGYILQVLIIYVVCKKYETKSAQVDNHFVGNFKSAHYFGYFWLVACKIHYVEHI
jgi:hypothetical protein